MAQQRFINFKDPISSFNANKKYLGIIPASVYRGFDTFTALGGLNFKLTHGITGNVFLNVDLTSSAVTGIWVTKAGEVIQEDGEIDLAIQTNAGNAFQRIDAVVGRHNHDVINVGGLPAVYSVVKGATGGPVAPVPSGNDWVILGYITIPANAANASTSTWQRLPIPSLGNKFPALLAEVNTYQDQQQEAQGFSVNITSGDYELADRNIIASLASGNSFVILNGGTLDLLPDKPNGTKIQLIFNLATTIRSFVNNLVGGTAGTGVRAGYLAGLRGIVLQNNLPLINLTIQARQVVTLIKVVTSHTFSAGDPIYGDYWQVLSVSDSPVRVSALEAALAVTNSALATATASLAALTTLLINVNPVGNIRTLWYTGLISANFDSSGLAKAGSIYVNHAIINGNNGTPAASGKVIVQYDPDDADFDTVGNSGGEKTHLLGVPEMPNHSHSMTGIGTDGSLTTGSGGHAVAPRGSGGPDTGSAGGGLAHNNMQPYMVMLKIMRIV